MAYVTTSGTPAATEPPSDPESWSDEQWLTWLKATDDVDLVDEPAPIVSRLARSTGGQVLGEAMKGLANAMYGPKDEEIVIVIEAGQPLNDEPFTVHIDRDHPQRSTAVFAVDDPDE